MLCRKCLTNKAMPNMRCGLCKRCYDRKRGTIRATRKKDREYRKMTVSSIDEWDGACILMSAAGWTEHDYGKYLMHTRALTKKRRQAAHGRRGRKSA